ncbi:hypothetical protein M3Y96_01213100 [Aphelenchoides besseyi]|nr:hypothetical protein M3Y96_01213100 [Aphelenchoides besseyi]
MVEETLNSFYASIRKSFFEVFTPAAYSRTARQRLRDRLSHFENNTDFDFEFRIDAEFEVLHKEVKEFGKSEFIVRPTTDSLFGRAFGDSFRFHTVRQGLYFLSLLSAVGRLKELKKEDHTSAKLLLNNWRTFLVSDYQRISGHVKRLRTKGFKKQAADVKLTAIAIRGYMASLTTFFLGISENKIEDKDVKKNLKKTRLPKSSASYCQLTNGKEGAQGSVESLATILDPKE